MWVCEANGHDGMSKALPNRPQYGVMGNFVMEQTMPNATYP